jgi:hypothetical protein
VSENVADRLGINAVSTGTSFATTQWGQWSPAVTQVNVQVGDFNGDGLADIIGRISENGQSWTGQSNFTAFTTSLWTTWSTTVTLDRRGHRRVCLVRR